MSEYRILKTNSVNKTFYQAQKKCLFIFWEYLLDGLGERRIFYSIEEARRAIERFESFPVCTTEIVERITL